MAVTAVTISGSTALRLGGRVPLLERLAQALAHYLLHCLWGRDTQGLTGEVEAARMPGLRGRVVHLVLLTSAVAMLLEERRRERLLAVVRGVSRYSRLPQTAVRSAMVAQTRQPPLRPLLWVRVVVEVRPLRQALRVQVDL